jgi:hypothetical protein
MNGFPSRYYRWIKKLLGYTWRCVYHQRRATPLFAENALFFYEILLFKNPFHKISVLNREADMDPLIYVNGCRENCVIIQE